MLGLICMLIAGQILYWSIFIWGIIQWKKEYFPNKKWSDVLFNERLYK